MGTDLNSLPAEEMRKRRKDLQIIFQDPQASLNPRMTVGEIVADPLKTLMPELNREQRRQRVMEMMEAVGLQPEMINRYPHEFSGGQAQRIGIARALITEPKLIVCDEPVSALDVSIQAQILNLLSELKDQFGLTLIFISHNLSVVRHVSDRIMVLYLGRMVELATGDELYQRRQASLHQGAAHGGADRRPQAGATTQHRCADRVRFRRQSIRPPAARSVRAAAMRRSGAPKSGRHSRQ